MYRIEISPGEETVLRTIEELATAIKNGLVTTRSRIYHNASQKWLPIEFHPHYKKALATPDHRPRPIPAAPAAALQLPTPVPPPEPARPPTPVLVAAPVPGRPAAPRRNVGFLLPAVVASLPLIEVELPELTYPEAPVAPARASYPSPTVPLPVARRRTTGSRPLLYAGAAVTLVVVGYLATTVAPSGQVAAEPAPAVAEVPAPQPGPEPSPPEGAELAPASIPEAPPASASVPSPAPPPAPPPAAVSTPAPAPALVPALTTAGARAGPPSQAWSSSAGATTPLPLPAPPAPVSAAPPPAITPAPAALDLTVPSLPGADSMAPLRSTRDTGAIGRILKAVGATKASEVKPAQ